MTPLSDHDKMILKFPKQIKLDVLRDFLEVGDTVKFWQFAKLLLDAPIAQGGILTDEINALYKQYYPTKKITTHEKDNHL